MSLTSDLKEAVELAKNGDKDAFGRIYENTYSREYKVALRYMKNESEAQDVLQDAYVKAWQKIGTLEDPDRLYAWLGRIVANTALDVLKKESPKLFTDLSVETGDGDEIPYEVEDETNERQPELKFTTDERSEIIREMIDSLSEEQRICTMMHYIEDIRIADIAKQLECPESTVKSRLSYARKNIRAAADRLIKKGYSFYGIAPIQVFTVLLKQDLEETTTVTPDVEGLMRAVEGVSQLSQSSDAVRDAVGGAATGLAGFFFHTTAGKIATTVIGGAIVVGLGVGAYQLTRDNTPAQTPAVVADETDDVEEVVNDITDDVDETQQPNEPDTEEPNDETQEQAYEPEDGEQIPVERYADVLEGGLDEEELEKFLLATASVADFTPDSIEDFDIGIFIDALPLHAEEVRVDGNEDLLYLDKVNHYLQIFTDKQITDKASSVPNVEVMGDKLYVDVGMTKDIDKITITSFARNGDILELDYEYGYQGESWGGEKTCHAILQKQADGKYRIYNVTYEATE